MVFQRADLPDELRWLVGLPTKAEEIRQARKQELRREAETAVEAESKASGDQGYRDQGGETPWESLLRQKRQEKAQQQLEEKRRYCDKHEDALKLCGKVLQVLDDGLLLEYVNYRAFDRSTSAWTRPEKKISQLVFVRVDPSPFVDGDRFEGIVSQAGRFSYLTVMGGRKKVNAYSTEGFEQDM